MRIRTRKFAGTIALLVLVAVWSLLGMTLAQTPWLAASMLYQAIFSVVGGVGSRAQGRPRRALRRPQETEVRRCPGRDAISAFTRVFDALWRSSCEALLRRTGTAPNAGFRYGPGSAAHRSASAPRCAASGARKSETRRSRNCECMPIPVPRSPLILLASCPVRGASRGVTEVGQSESLAGAG